MQRIKLSATDSTNAYLKRLLQEKDLSDATVVQADQQTAGRGQRGSGWTSEPGKNLTFSVLKYFTDLPAREHFKLNMSVSLSVVSVLDTLEIPDVAVKWPNDILSGRNKVCGILIENTLQKDLVLRSIIGIGLNVNQADFPGLAHAASLAGITGKSYDTATVLDTLLESLEKALVDLEQTSYDELLQAYESRLFMKGQPALFCLAGGGEFHGEIRGVGPEGKLLISGDSETRSYGLGEIRLNY